MTDRVAIVVVSHSAQLAEGVAELAGQMAPDVSIRAAGGGDDGGLGTSFDRITEALADLPVAGAVVVYDLGSALLTTETALEFLDDPSRIRVVDAPIAEGALAAATTAQGGAGLDEVAAAAAGQAAAVGAVGGEQVRELVLTNPLGLHARPAAELVRALAGLDAAVRVGRPDRDAIDARAVLAVVRLALRGGDTFRVAADGPDAGIALDRIAALVAAGFGERATAPVAETAGTGPAPGAPGLAVGPLVRLSATATPKPRPADPAVERGRLTAAVAAASARLAGGDAFARAHAALLADPQLIPDDAALAAGAEHAWWAAASGAAAGLADAPDELVAARAADVREAGAAVLAELGLPLDPIPADPAGTVLVADELGPGEISEFAARGGAAVVLAGGSPTAHAVVVARGLGLPLVLRAGPLLDCVADGTPLAVDGSAGTVDVDPPDLAARRAAVERASVDRDARRARAAEPVTVAGRRILVAANVGSLAEARAAADNGADAVGLLRTELLLLDRPQLPDEDTQTAELAEIFAVLGHRPVVVRVLDAGGDKPVRALDLDPQRNGFLGVRGLRWLLANPEVLHTQLRAICRAAAGHRVSVMAPMVSVAGEAAAFRSAVESAVASLDGVPHARPEAIGVMVEVPAAAVAADELVPHVDFFSIGTNDLTSYTMAADRTEPGVADLLDPPRTALWRLVGELCRLAGDTPVAVCGELAAVPEYARRFVELGATELSMAPPRIPELKEYLRDG